MKQKEIDRIRFGLSNDISFLMRKKGDKMNGTGVLVRFQEDKMSRTRERAAACVYAATAAAAAAATQIGHETTHETHKEFDEVFIVFPSTRSN